jgi:hypothetical protein
MLRDPSWVKSRIYARLILRHHAQRMNARDLRLARRLKQDPGVTNRLINQAMTGLCLQKGVSYHELRRNFLGLDV